MAYSPIFNPAYAAWHDLPTEDTPVTAAVMANYDGALQNIESFLDGSTAIKPMEKTGLMTQSVGVDSNGALFTSPIGDAVSINSNAVIYDNTESGMTATDVQAAIDELADGAGSPVNPVVKTSNMTQAVGVDSDGLLWTAPGGGSGGGSGYTVTTLCVPASTDTTYNLSDSIDNYDEILLICQLDSNNLKYVFESRFPSTEMMDAIGQTYRFGVTTDSSYIYVSVSDANTLVKDVSGGTPLVITGIAGIKYGSCETSASGTEYDNTSSGLTATNVQAAIDEIDTTIDTPETVTTLSDSDYVYLNIGGNMKRITLANLKTVLGI